MDYNLTSESKYYYESVTRSKQFPIMVYFHSREELTYCAKHWHRSLEVCCYMSTPVTVWINGKTKEYPADGLIIFNYGDVHELVPHNLENPLGVSLIFPYEFLMDYSVKLDGVQFLDSAGERWDGELRKSLHKIVSLSFNEKQDQYYYLLVNAEIFRLLHILVTHYCVKDTNSLESLWHLDRCKQILAYIDNNFNCHITLESLAGELELSVSYLARYFNKYLGTTFKQHLTSVRLQHALFEVLRNDKTMLDIAIECGFPDYRSFIKAFRKWYHFTPYKYRKIQQERAKSQVIDRSRPELAFAKHLPGNPDIIESKSS